jgi:hypothetical protein
VVPKHRRSEAETALVPARAPLSAAEFWSDELGRRRADPLARRRPAHARALGSPASDRTGPMASMAGQDDEGWPLGPGQPSWDAWGPPPALHPDHPSAPVPRVRVQVDYNDPVEFTGPLPRLNGNGHHTNGRRPANPARAAQSAPQQAPRGGGPAQAYGRQDFPPPWTQSPYQGNAAQGYTAQGYTAQGFAAQGYAWQAYGAAQAYAEPAEYEEPRGYAGAQAYAEPATRVPAESYPEEQDYAGPDPSAYARPPRQARPRPTPGEPRGYQAARGRLHAVPSGPDLNYQSGPDSGAWAGRGPDGPPPGGRTASRDQQDYTAAVREAAEREAKAIREQAAQEAAALTREATQQAAKIREAAEKEAAQMRAALAAMSGEMGRVAAYVSENLTVPAIPAARPAEAPVTRPTNPSSLRELPAAPDTRPERPVRPERPAPRPARPATAPAVPGKEPGRRTRQQNAMRVSKFAVAAGLLGVAAAASTEFALHGPSFFVFRQGGAGETPGNFTDQNFLAQQQAREHPKPTQPRVVKPAAKTAKPAPKSSP